MKTIISIQNLSINFDDKPALNDVSFDVYDGEIFGFLGPSGAGKTTTIKAMTHQLKVPKGTIHIFDKPIEASQRATYHNLGIMTDSNDVYDNLSVYDNLLFFARIKGVDDREVEPLLQRVGLASDKKKLAKKLSKGMRQRLILATALINHPKLLFLDEPTAALDPKTTAEIHALLRSINQNGTTIFLTTHSMSEADKLCDRIAFLDGGHVVEMGEKQALKLKYAKNEVEVTYADGSQCVVTKDVAGLQHLLENANPIKTIHSNEPSLETIFLTVTGRDNYEIA